MTPLQYRILEIAYPRKLSHLGSCLGMVGILDEIYSYRDEDEPVVLSCGHTGLALYTVLEKHLGKNAEELFDRHGVHPNKNLEDGIYCTTGHLGHGLGLAIGRALSNRKRRVWCAISDGECAAGPIYEGLALAGRLKLTNLKVYCHSNGYTACQESDPTAETALSFLFPVIFRGRRPDDLGFPFLKGLDAHYCAQTDEDWAWVQTHKP